MESYQTIIQTVTVTKKELDKARHLLLRVGGCVGRCEYFHVYVLRSFRGSFLSNEATDRGFNISDCNIGIKHGFSCINIRKVPWEVLKTEAEGRGFQHLPRDLANVNALKKHVRSLLLHKNGKHLLHFALFLALFCFTFSLMSRNFH